MRRVVEPILTGAADHQACSDRGPRPTCCDLGLVAQDSDGGPPRIANPIYSEVVPRHLNYAVQETLPQQDGVVREPGRRVGRGEGLIAAFQEFFREHSEHWVQRFERYHEAGPQLLLQAHLQRIVNGGGRIEREYALGRGRTDLLIVWPQGGRERRFVVECKVRRKGLERTIAEGSGADECRYVDRCGAEAGHLVVFDRTPDRTWSQKIFRRPSAGAWRHRSRSGGCSADVAPSARPASTRTTPFSTARSAATPRRAGSNSYDVLASFLLRGTMPGHSDSRKVGFATRLRLFEGVMATLATLVIWKAEKKIDRKPFCSATNSTRPCSPR